MWHQLRDPADPAHVAAVVAALDGAPARCGGIRVIAIDGPSGSGKTTLAKGVSDALDAPVVHMDRIYPGWDGLAVAPALLAEQVLAPLARGELGAYRLWDWASNEWSGSAEVPPAALGTGILVVEGCGCSVGPAGEYAAVRVWVEAPRAERMRRGLARDGETYRPHWQRWAAQEAELYARDRTRDRADLILTTG